MREGRHLRQKLALQTNFWCQNDPLGTQIIFSQFKTTEMCARKGNEGREMERGEWDSAQEISRPQNQLWEGTKGLEA